VQVTANDLQKSFTFKTKFKSEAACAFQLVGQQEGHPACKKTEWWDAGMVTCLGRGADLHIAQLMPTATHCLLLQ